MNPSVHNPLNFVYPLGKWQGQISSFLLLIATFQVCFELVLRYGFNSPTMWGLELTIYLCGITYLTSGAYAEYHKAHIKVDILYGLLPLRVRAVLDLFLGDMALCFFSGVLGYHSFLWFLEALVLGETSGTLWAPPIWPMRLLMVISSTTLFFMGVVNLLRDFVIGLGLANQESTRE